MGKGLKRIGWANLCDPKPHFERISRTVTVTCENGGLRARNRRVHAGCEPQSYV